MFYFFFSTSTQVLSIGLVELVFQVVVSRFVAVLGDAAIIDVEDLATRALARRIN